MSKDKILAPLVPGQSLIPGLPSLRPDKLLGEIPIVGDLPLNPTAIGDSLASGSLKPLERSIEGVAGGLKPKTPNVPPLPPVLPAPPPLPPTQRGSDVVGQAVSGVRRVRSSRGRNLFNVGGSRGIGAVQPVVGSGRRQLGA